MSSDREIVGQGARRGPKIGVHTFRNRLDVYSSNGSKKPELFKPILGLTYAPHTRHFELRSYRDNGGLTDGSPLFQIGARSIEWYMHTTEPTSDARVRLRKTQDGDVLLNMTTRDSLNAFISLLKRWCPRAKQIIVSKYVLHPTV